MVEERFFGRDLRHDIVVVAVTIDLQTLVRGSPTVQRELGNFLSLTYDGTM